jgi:hypothetical protein
MNCLTTIEWIWLSKTVLKLARNANLDGLINCLPPTQDSFVTNPKINAFKLCSIYKILWHPDCLVYRDSIFGLAGRRSGALFFARHLDSFIVTQNSQSLPGLGTFSTVLSCTRTLQSSTRTGKKRGTATLRFALGRLRRQLIKPPGRYV